VFEVAGYGCVRLLRVFQMLVDGDRFGTDCILNGGMKRCNEGERNAE
jgi:hypothetical protein